MTVVIDGLSKEDVIGLKSVFMERVVELPAHGDLIDRDALVTREFRYLLLNGNGSPKVVFARAIDEAPVIIAAGGAENV